MVFVPCGSLLNGWSRRRQSSSWLYIYLDPHHFLFDGESSSTPAPRLFFSDPQLYSTARKVKQLMRAPHARSNLHAETLGTLPLLELLCGGGNQSTGDRARGGLSPRCVATLRDYIQDNIARRILIADLSALVNLSPYDFVRAFKRSFGVPPHQFLTRCRIERAKHLLSNTAQSTTKISLAVS